MSNTQPGPAVATIPSITRYEKPIDWINSCAAVVRGEAFELPVHPFASTFAEALREAVRHIIDHPDFLGVGVNVMQRLRRYIRGKTTEEDVVRSRRDRYHLSFSVRDAFISEFKVHLNRHVVDKDAVKAIARKCLTRDTANVRYHGFSIGFNPHSANRGVMCPATGLTLFNGAIHLMVDHIPYGCRSLRSTPISFHELEVGASHLGDAALHVAIGLSQHRFIDVGYNIGTSKTNFYYRQFVHGRVQAALREINQERRRYTHDTSDAWYQYVDRGWYYTPRMGVVSPAFAQEDAVPEHIRQHIELTG